jgi:hypothetical protein
MQSMNQIGHMLKLARRQLLQLFHNHFDLAHTLRNYSASLGESRPAP